MKRRDLMTRLEEAGCELLCHGWRHDIYHNPSTKKTQPVPRHREIDEVLAKKILSDRAKPQQPRDAR